MSAVNIQYKVRRDFSNDFALTLLVSQPQRID
jgi:hypothetical protein